MNGFFNEFFSLIAVALVSLLAIAVYLEIKLKAAKEDLNFYKALNKELETDYKALVETTKKPGELFREIFPNGTKTKYDLRYKLNKHGITKAFESKDFELLKDMFITYLYDNAHWSGTLMRLSDQVIQKNYIVAGIEKEKKDLLQRVAVLLTELSHTKNDLFLSEQTIEHFKKLHPRAVRLLEIEKHFIVVTWDEPYFEQVYTLIKEHELEKGNWHEDDEKDYQKWVRRNQELIPRETHA